MLVLLPITRDSRVCGFAAGGAPVDKGDRGKGRQRPPRGDDACKDQV